MILKIELKTLIKREVIKIGSFKRSRTTMKIYKRLRRRANRRKKERNKRRKGSQKPRKRSMEKLLNVPLKCGMMMACQQMLS